MTENPRVGSSILSQAIKHLKQSQQLSDTPKIRLVAILAFGGTSWGTNAQNSTFLLDFQLAKVTE